MESLFFTRRNIFKDTKIDTKSDKTAAGDRFIPLRSNLELSNYIINKKNVVTYQSIDSGQLSTYVNFAVRTFKHNNYRQKLWDTIITNSSLKIFNYCKSEGQKTKSYNVLENPDWPVQTRKRRPITAPCNILDMPGLKFNLKYNTADWGGQGYLASVYLREVYFWHSDISASYRQTASNKQARSCLKWNCDGSLIAVALYPQGFIILDPHLLKFKPIFDRCKTGYCFTTSFAWKRDGSFFTGCAEGYICHYVDRRLTRVWDTYNQKEHYYSLIIKMEMSCSDKHIAALDGLGIIHIVKVDGKDEIFAIDGIRRDMAWHPWNDSLLATATDSYGIELINIRSMRKLMSLPLFTSSYMIDALSFNPLTAELVVSVYLKDMKDTIILVMSSFTKQVDAIKWHDHRVQYLLWSPDGTQLATAGGDESMCIWNFFGFSKEDITKKVYKNPTASLLDFNGFGTAIR